MKLSWTEIQNLFYQSMASQKTDPKLAEIIQPGGTLSDSESALKVYQTAYPARLTEALGEDFDAVWSVLGDEGFHTLCSYYIKNHPSKSYTLSDYGKGFPDFISKTNLGGSLPFLESLARFELCFLKVFHSPYNSLPTLLESEDQFDIESRLQLPIGIEFFESPFAVFSIWDQRENLGHFLDEESNWNFTEFLSLFRNHNKVVCVQKWSKIEFQLLKRIAEHKKLEPALTEIEDITQEKLTHFFSTALNTGLVRIII